MTLEKLIQDLEDVQNRLCVSIDHGSLDEVRAMDGSVVESFEKILNLEPENMSEQNKLVEFLLQQLPSFCPTGQINKQISARIAKLATNSQLQ